jgi:signal transduction histidine kinase
MAPGEGGLSQTTVLVVDDEPKSLDLLRRTLRGTYRVLQAINGAEGLRCLEGCPVAAVVADQRMPGMTGVEFLAESSRRFPRTERILLTGFTEAEWLVAAINQGRVFGYVAKPWHPEELLALLRRAVETHHLRRDRERLLAEMHAKNRELTRLLEETRQLQKEKIQAERWAALGKLAAMVAHDLRSPLAAIQCQAGLLQESGPEEGRMERSSHAILSQVQNMRGYIDELLLFSGPEHSASARRPYEISALILSLQEAFSQRCRSAGVRLTVEMGFRGPCPLHPTQIYRVLENILQNAVHAAGKGGEVLLASGKADNGDLVIRIADSGPGIAGEIRNTLFEPFATLGKAGGTGLGLAVVDKIVREHGGRVWEERWRLQGACFHVLLPGGPSKDPGVDPSMPGVEHQININ